MSYKKRSKAIFTKSYILGYSISRLLSEIHDADLSSLSAYSKFKSIEIHIAYIEGSQLRYTEPRRVYTLRYRIITDSLDSNLFLYRLEKTIDLIITQKYYFSIRRPHKVKQSRID